MVLKLRPVVTMAGIDQILEQQDGRVPHLFWQQDGRVVKAPSFGEERTKYTPDMPGFNPAAKKVHRLGGWY